MLNSGARGPFTCLCSSAGAADCGDPSARPAGARALSILMGGDARCNGPGPRCTSETRAVAVLIGRACLGGRCRSGQARVLVAYAWGGALARKGPIWPGSAIAGAFLGSGVKAAHALPRGSGARAEPAVAISARVGMSGRAVKGAAVGARGSPIGTAVGRGGGSTTVAKRVPAAKGGATVMPASGRL